MVSVLYIKFYILSPCLINQRTTMFYLYFVLFCLFNYLFSLYKPLLMIVLIMVYSSPIGGANKSMSVCYGNQWLP